MVRSLSTDGKASGLTAITQPPPAA
jgi:hypothetical protein